MATSCHPLQSRPSLPPVRRARPSAAVPRLVRADGSAPAGVSCKESAAEEERARDSSCPCLSLATHPNALALPPPRPHLCDGRGGAHVRALSPPPPGEGDAPRAQLLPPGKRSQRRRRRRWERGTTLLKPSCLFSSIAAPLLSLSLSLSFFRCCTLRPCSDPSGRAHLCTVRLRAGRVLRAKTKRRERERLEERGDQGSEPPLNERGEERRRRKQRAEGAAAAGEKKRRERAEQSIIALMKACRRDVNLSPLQPCLLSPCPWRPAHPHPPLHHTLH